MLSGDRAKCKGLEPTVHSGGVYPGASRGTSFVYIAELDNFKQAELQHFKRSMHLPRINQGELLQLQPLVMRPQGPSGSG